MKTGLRRYIVPLALALLLIATWWITKTFRAAPRLVADQLMVDSWQGFKQLYIDSEGRVQRPMDGNDTVSEGQAYAMLRAVWLDDKETFDLCYRWSEEHLSRYSVEGDHLLAWHWAEGAVTDWMPASDADLDYALSLLSAAVRWPDQAPAKLPAYKQKALDVLSSIMSRETFTTPGGTRYLAPWILRTYELNYPRPLNPSYFSPAHFRVFFQFTGDRRWLELVETTYTMLTEIAWHLGEEQGVGLVPDWIAVTAKDRFVELKGKNHGFGWEAVRVPFRVLLDHLWFESPESKTFLSTTFGKFLSTRLAADQPLYAEYQYDGSCSDCYEHPLFYSAYALALMPVIPKEAERLQARVLESYHCNASGCFFLDPKDYFTNALIWITPAAFSELLERSSPVMDSLFPQRDGTGTLLGK